MFCKQCGQQLADGTLFCSNCGAAQTENAPAPETTEVSAPEMTQAPTQEPAQETTTQAQEAYTPAPEMSQPYATPQKENPLKKPIKIPGLNKEFSLATVVGACAAVVVVFLLLLVLVFSNSGSKEAFSLERPANSIYFTDDGIVNLEGTLCKDFTSSDIYSTYSSVDYKSIFFIVYDDMALYYLTPDMKTIHVADNVYSVKVSLDGTAAAYTIVEDSYSECELFVFNTKNQKSTKIDSNVHNDYICISPSGKMVGYIKNYESSTDNSLYLGGVNKEGVKVDKDGCFPVAVSDNGKNFYYVDTANYENKLYFYNGKESQKVISDCDSRFWFNNSVTEVLFTKNSKTYYYTPKMEDPEKISNDQVYSILAPYTATANCGYNSNIYYVAKDTFKNTVLITYDGLSWINQKASDTVKIASSVSTCQISEDGQSLIYVKNNKLYKVDKISESMVSEVLYDTETVVRTIASVDLSKIYVVTDDDELHYIKKANKTERISNDISDEYDVYYNSITGKICYLEDDTLYTAGTTSKSKSSIASDVKNINARGEGVVYYVRNDDDEVVVYFLGKKPVELYRYDY